MKRTILSQPEKIHSAPWAKSLIQVAARHRILRQVGTARWVPRPAAIHGLDLHHIRLEGTVALAKMQVSAVAEKSQAEK